MNYIFKSGDTIVFWMFFPFVYLTNFMLAPVLVAMVNIRVEQYLLDKLKNGARKKSGTSVASLFL